LLSSAPGVGEVGAGGMLRGAADRRELEHAAELDQVLEPDALQPQHRDQGLGGYRRLEPRQRRGRSMSKILILAGDAAESLEVMYPYQRLLEEGYEVHLAGPSKKKLQFVVHDFVDGYDTYTEKPGYTWDADLAFADVDPEDDPGWTRARVHPQRR
jgi:hypothetical protein